MGLAAANEVPAFGVLENAVPPVCIVDQTWGGAYAAHSFPWFGATPMTVTTTRAHAGHRRRRMGPHRRGADAHRAAPRGRGRRGILLCANTPHMVADVRR